METSRSNIWQANYVPTALGRVRNFDSSLDSLWRAVVDAVFPRKVSGVADSSQRRPRAARDDQESWKVSHECLRSVTRGMFLRHDPS